MNFALCYPTAPKDKEDSMSDGLYRPYFHGELVAEYRKSLRSKSSRKPPANGVEAQRYPEEQADEEYVEPGTRHPQKAGKKLAKLTAADGN